MRNNLLSNHYSIEIETEESKFLKSIKELEQIQKDKENEIRSDTEKWEVYFKHFNRYYDSGESHALANLSVNREIDSTWWDLWNTRQKCIMKYAHTRDTGNIISNEEYRQMAMHPGFIYDLQTGDCWIMDTYVGTRKAI